VKMLVADVPHSEPDEEEDHEEDALFVVHGITPE
jgi:hypothetical protein